MALFTRDHAPKAPAVPVPASDRTDTEVVFQRIELLAPNPYQPRTEFDEASIAEMAVSIKEHGFLQAIIITERNDGQDGYFILMGERRVRAAKQLGLTKVPTLLRTVTSKQEMAELGLIENIQRQDLSPLESARAYERLATEFGLTQEQIAERTGKDRTSISKALTLLKAPTIVQAAVADGTLTMTKALLMKDLSTAEARPLLKKAKGEKSNAGKASKRKSKLTREEVAGQVANLTSQRQGKENANETDKSAPPIRNEAGPEFANRALAQSVLNRLSTIEKMLVDYSELTGTYLPGVAVRRALAPMLTTLREGLGIKEEEAE